MPSDRSLVEREMERVELRPFTLDGFHRNRQRRERNRRIGSALVALLVAGVAIGGLLRMISSSGTVPADDARDPFLGTWVSTTDADGGTQKMAVRASADDAVEIVVTDDVASVCSGGSSTMTGAGRIEDGTALVIPSPVYTCDDGSEPETLSGPPLQEQLRDWTLVLDLETDTLSDGVGGVWLRKGAESPSPEPLEGLDGSQSWDPSSFGGTWESTPADTGFLGTWESTDVDGSSLLLGVRVAEDPSAGYEILLIDGALGGAEGCYSSRWNSLGTGPITMAGIGRVEGSELAMDSQTWLCEGGPGQSIVSGDRSLKLAAGHTPLVYDPETDTLVGPAGRVPDAPSWMQGFGAVWHRRSPGSDPIALPFWGVWPQTNLQEAQEAQRRADAGDPAFSWQLAPELASELEGETFEFPYVFPKDPAAADRAEIVARFFRDVVGWERYLTVAKHDPAWSGGAGWSFVRIRCGPGTNPLYPNDPNGGDCAPTISDTHYETVSLMVTQPVRSGPTGIWVVSGWTELASSEDPASDLRYHEWVDRQYEQVAPPTQAELEQALEAFLAARVAGEGAEAFLTEPFLWWQARPRVPLLYATTEGHRYERFEIVNVDEPLWPAGTTTVTVRLFARGGSDVVEQALVVWPDPRGQLTMDTPWRGSTTENGEPVPDRSGSGS